MGKRRKVEPGEYVPTCPGPKCNRPRALKGNSWCELCEGHMKQRLLHPDRPLKPLRQTYDSLWERLHEAWLELEDRLENAGPEEVRSAKERLRLAAKAWVLGRRKRQTNVVPPRPHHGHRGSSS